jgi:hypothetical protein
MNQQRIDYDARLAEIRKLSAERARLEQRTQPELSNAAIMNMAIYSAEQGAN